jgi:hypothetical protein
MHERTSGPSANVELVRSIYAAWERGDYSRAGEWAHREIEYVNADGPAPGIWTGAQGMAALREAGSSSSRIRTGICCASSWISGSDSRVRTWRESRTRSRSADDPYVTPRRTYAMLHIRDFLTASRGRLYRGRSGDAS